MKSSDCVYYADRYHSIIYTHNDYQLGISPYFNKHAKGYRLPTEVKWEFAARGGDTNNACWYHAFSGIDTINSQAVITKQQHLFYR